MVQSVDRALDILELVSSRPENVGITELAAFLKISKSAAHALVGTLVKRDFLHQDPTTRRYGLGTKIARLGLIMTRHSPLGQSIHPWADMLCERFQVVVHVGILAGEQALVIERLEPKTPYLLFPQSGSSMSIHSTAVGKVLLAFSSRETRKRILETAPLARKTPNTITGKGALTKELIRITRRGYAVDMEESLPGVVCVGAPIRDRSGEVIAAISLSGAKSRLEGKEMEAEIEAVRGTAMRISSVMGYLEHNFPTRANLKQG